VISNRSAVPGLVHLDAAGLDVVEHRNDGAFHLEVHVRLAPIGAFAARGTIPVPAFADNELAGADLPDGLVDAPGTCAAELVVPVEEAEVGHVPAFRGHGPVLAGEVKDGGRLGNGAGVVLGLARIDGVDDIGSLLVDGDLDAGILEFILELFFHPFQSFQVILLENPHLVADLPLVLGNRSHALRHHSHVDKQTPGHAVEGGHVHAHGAIERAAAAVGALAEDNILQLFQLLVGVDAPGAHPPGDGTAGPVNVGLEKLADLVRFVSGRVSRVPGISQDVVALVRAQAAMNAGGQ